MAESSFRNTMSEHNILYNVTIKIHKEIEEEWCSWMLKTHIPKVMNTGCFTNSHFNKMLFVKDDDGETYTIQYLCENMKTLQAYLGSHAPKLQKEHQERYKDKFVAFRSVMEVRGKF
jgi:hypothetical protein